MSHGDNFWHIEQRNGTAALWVAQNPVLNEGEVGWETDTRRCKLGDGVTAWNDLPYASDAAADVAALDVRVDAIETTEATYGDIVTHNASEFTTDAELAAVDARLDVLEAATAPGKELGYAERTTTHTTTATTAAGAADISGFSVGPITGTGRPVEANFYTSSVTHSVANSNVSAFISVNGAVGGSLGQFGGQSSPSTTAGLGDALNLTRRVVLTDGVSYTFTVRAFSLVAGTSSIYGAAGVPMSLAVTAR